ncbi:CRISPR-associated endoribonuclease Cas6 [Pyrobaculum ferrireducens]|uniref:CRISPR-associated protein Cas6 C-terminal domain-containing protein n=1 Tax=Pyrobaculum ferrireducens TaxID=1104324 RepID=G7VBL4_9CREN|nr:CRISPR-associated endoribonuclease Cas6 [Pyrobaculum ferrireducens]AET32444.1 hypothetical protein P186_1005 [Pyrobaculum ferrireducens]
MERRFLRATYALTPGRDLVVQALTSRVAKQAVLQWFTYPGAGTPQPEKPLKFSYLHHQGRPLWGDGETPVAVRGGEVYHFQVVADVDRLGEDLALRLLQPPREVKIYGAPARLELAEASIEAAAPLHPGRYVTVRFKTPTLLQYPKPPRVKAPTTHTLYPQPRLLILNLIQRARAYGVEAPLSLYVYAPFDLVESTHAVRPAAVYVGPHHAVGFTGVITYRLDAPAKRARWIAQLLGLARYIGVGHSTAMGFGWVEITTQ